MPLKITDKKTGKPIEFSARWFPGGESSFKLTPLGQGPGKLEVVVKADLYSSNDVMEMVMACEALRSQNCSIKLIIPYLPYARQDRVCHAGEGFSLEAFVEIIRGMSAVHSVECWDVHNPDLTRSLFETPRESRKRWITFENAPAKRFAKHIVPNDGDFKPFMVVAPDKGALNRANDVAEALGATGVFHAHKTRLADGSIQTVLPVEVSFGDMDLLMVDDICDGGRTFIELAKLLRPKTTGMIELYVTHGIFSAGNEVFKDLIDNIYTANLFPRPAWPTCVSCDVDSPAGTRIYKIVE